MSDSLWPHEAQHARPPCPSSTPGVHSDSRPLSQWCHPAISSSVVPFSSCLQSLPASESFPMSQLFAWGGRSTGVSALASFLPKKSQGWSSEWTGWISLQSKGLSRVFSNTWDLSLRQMRTSNPPPQKGGQRDILNLRWKTRRSLSVCLSVWIYVCLSVSLLFFDNIAEVVSSYLNNLKKKEALTNSTILNTIKNWPKWILDSCELGNNQY